MRRRAAARSLLRQARRALDELDLPESFTLETLRVHIERHRHRRIHLGAATLPGTGLHGLWIAAEDTDYVFYHAEAVGSRRLQIIGHEFGHLLLDDPPPSETGHVSYSDLAERRAELFGTLVVQRIALCPPQPDPTPDQMGHEQELLARLTRTLEAAPDHD